MSIFTRPRTLEDQGLQANEREREHNAAGAGGPLIRCSEREDHHEAADIGGPKTLST